MTVDAALTVNGISDVADAAKKFESQGYDGLYTFEGPHDPFFPLLMAAEHSRELELTTAVAIAFARTPMTLATLAYDLQLASHGRFNLGLGTQIKPHIEKRFSMPWSHPAARMREMVLAIRAIWASWHEGAKLDFRGEFYTHTLMTPMFSPGPNPYGLPRIMLAGVGPRMTEVAGEVADGFIVHPFTTEQFLRETTIPALTRGRGGSLDGFEIAFPVMTVAYSNEEEHEKGVAAMRPRLAFYGSTPAYRPVLDTHGWGDLQPELNALSKQGDWAKMSALITDEMVDALCVVAYADEIPAKILRRYGDIVTRVSIEVPKSVDVRPLIGALRSGA